MNSVGLASLANQTCAFHTAELVLSVIHVEKNPIILDLEIINGHIIIFVIKVM